MILLGPWTGRQMLEDHPVGIIMGGMTEEEHVVFDECSTSDHKYMTGAGEKIADFPWMMEDVALIDNAMLIRGNASRSHPVEGEEIPDFNDAMWLLKQLAGSSIIVSIGLPTTFEKEVMGNKTMSRTSMGLDMVFHAYPPEIWYYPSYSPNPDITIGETIFRSISSPTKL